MKIASAPISWGVCEVPGWGKVLDPATVLGEMAELGIRATELGPPGYLPRDPGPLLAEHGLTLIGGFLATPLHQEHAVAEARRTIEVLAAAGAEVLVLAAATGLDGYDARPVLGDEEWAALVDGARRVRDAAAERGLRTVLHPHVGTHVENRDEVRRFLADSELALCLDTGHLLIGGTDPVELAERYPERIGHLHLKDVRADLVAEVRAGRIGYADAVGRGLYVPLGKGDVDVTAVLRFVHRAGYEGWHVLEQDTALGEHSSLDTPKRDTAASLRFLNSTA